ncbi:hypothetical protein [Streptomyces sp. 150FB]|uniref:hypothetical protein n=1 Tax=Streptomyces sp. 150FB TaxID=1576605 RepID=UPI000AF67EAE|nr:hypothetical protein [Streptomyces sp. 150FB]
MLRTDSPLGRLIKALAAVPLPRRYPPSGWGPLCAALAVQPLPDRRLGRESASVREGHPSAGTDLTG